MMMKCLESSSDFVSCFHTMSFSSIMILLFALVILTLLFLFSTFFYMRTKVHHNKMVQRVQSLEQVQDKVLQEHTALSTQLKANEAQSSEKNNLLSQGAEDQSRFSAMRAAYSDQSHGFWRQKTQAGVPDGYWPSMKNSIPIMMIANSQNGSGKTTIAAYLAASYAAQGQKVLVVDLDYQGKLSQMMRAESGMKFSAKTSVPSTLERVLSATVFDNWPDVAILDAQKNLDYISAGQSLEVFERSMEFSWLLGDEDDDMRYRLARVLLSSHVQNNYDRVILDSSSRMSATFVNGFCAATHVFIPCADTKYAMQGLLQTTRVIADLKPLNQVIALGGIIPIKMGVIKDGSGADITDHIIEKSTHITGDILMADIESLSAFPEKGLVGLRQRSVQKSFAKLARELSKIAPMKA